jgi:3D (Asp-Asp-Asp) domain-containing protein
MRTLRRTAVVLAAVLVGAVPAGAGSAAPRAGATLRLTATAYCHAGKTQSGAHTRTGIVAADPHVLPVGSVVRIDQPKTLAGIYTVMDTGGAVNGSHLDIFMPDCARAERFGKQPIRVRVLRRGWDPKASAEPHQGSG